MEEIINSKPGWARYQAFTPDQTAFEQEIKKTILELLQPVIKELHESHLTNEEFNA